MLAKINEQGNRKYAITCFGKYKFPLYFRILIHNLLSGKSFRLYNMGQLSKNNVAICNGPLQQGVVTSPTRFSLLAQSQKIHASFFTFFFYH